MATKKARPKAARSRKPGRRDPRPVERVSRRSHSPGHHRIYDHTAATAVETAHERDRALALSEKRHREIVDTASEGICIVDEQNDIVFANRRLGAMLAQSVEEFTGRSAYELIPDEDRSQARDEFENRKVGEAAEVRLRRADGTTVWTNVSTTVLHDEHGRFTGMLRMYSDVSAVRELTDSRQSWMRELLAAQERERERIARELHDQMGQHVVALALGVGKLARLAASLEEAQPLLSQLREIADLLGRDVHTLAFQLRPAALDHLGVAVALTSYCEHVAARSGVEVDVHCDDLSTLKLSGSTQTGLYRIAQEALTNAIKHARAKRVSVILERRPDDLVLIIEDDGKGLPPRAAATATGSGFGITGMRERATLLGGTLSIESSVGHGTTLYVRIPLVHHEQSAATSPR
jgi:two-component system sensor histidine kinase UhpB